MALKGVHKGNMSPIMSVKGHKVPFCAVKLTLIGLLVSELGRDIGRDGKIGKLKGMLVESPF